ncbi:hypothetical protein D9757_011757 [Collybiopsis confluens]|uniref:Nephrocystin 3-like N-terminal domain-containing protein n=1 Tax=Collybiopsis confluens TaxID=2823264 RepID=A0A8H5GI42_9AGAR|nr:hypothetical protein D9757_011757 [Collybiopsis confluens]
MLNKAHDFSISGGVFYSAGGNIIIDEAEKGLQILHRYCSTSASYSSGARYPPPLCYPGTRESMLRDLKHWSKSTDGSKVRWLYGPAGAGKSAIAQTFAQTCADSGKVVESFFFWRSDQSRNHPRQVFTTIALQMAVATPELRPIVDAAVVHDPFALTSSIDIQCNALIIHPWLKYQLHQQLKDPGARLSRTSSKIVEAGSSHSSSLIPHSTATPSRILIIDGLDECSNSRDQQHILSILSMMVEKHNLPFRILICSRPEPRIKESFGGTEFKKICKWMVLDSTYEASKDIRVFLIDGFKDILARHSHSMEHVRLPWPSAGQIEYLVQKSSGQFIYVSTVLKYIGDDGDVPADRLNIVLGLHPRDPEDKDHPFAELDALYMQILSTVKKPAVLRKILAAQIAFCTGLSSGSLSTNLAITDLLDIPPGVLNATVSTLHSLFKSPSPVESRFQFCHASFTDFLLDPKRSLAFHIEKSLGHNILAQYCLDYFHSNLNTRRIYARSYWEYHCGLAHETDELIAKLDSFPMYTALTEGIKKTQIYPYRFHPLLDFLQLIFQLWDRIQNICGTRIQHLRDISTIGFTLIFTVPNPSSRDESGAVSMSPSRTDKRFDVPVRYPPSICSAIAGERYDEVNQSIKAYLKTKAPRMNFEKICPVLPETGASPINFV